MTEPVVPPSIDALPPAPLPTDTPAEFDAKGFALVAAQGDMVEQINAANAATHQNATVAYTAAQAAVPAAAQATEARDQVLPARDETLDARDQAVPAAASALDAAQRAEAAAESIEDGPVTSVNGQTGVVDLTADLQSMALLF